MYYQLTSPAKLFQVPFPYIRKEHIEVRVNDTPVTDFTWSGDSAIEFSDLLSAGTYVRISRHTPVDSMLTDFWDGTILSEKELDMAALQLLYLIQEAFDGISDALQWNPEKGYYDALGRPIGNVGDPIDEYGVITLSYYYRVLYPEIQEYVDGKIEQLKGYIDAQLESLRGDMMNFLQELRDYFSDLIADIWAYIENLPTDGGGGGGGSNVVELESLEEYLALKDEGAIVEDTIYMIGGEGDYIPDEPADVPVVGITLEGGAHTFNGLGLPALQLNYTVFPPNATDKSVVWDTSNPGAVTVDDNGVVTGVGFGTSLITIETVDGGFKDHKYITVLDTDGGGDVDELITGTIAVDDIDRTFVEGDTVWLHELPTENFWVHFSPVPEEAEVTDVFWESDCLNIGSPEELSPMVDNISMQGGEGYLTVTANGNKTVTIRIVDITPP